MFPLALGYGTRTWCAPSRARRPTSARAYEDVSFTTSDGLELEGWYIPSRNGAAVIAFPGRSGPQKHARMLARHGYGVLLFDRRGEGESDGDRNLFGWGGDKDILAAIEFLKTRPDVDPDRIGGIGLSVGGELMLQTAAETDDARRGRLRRRRHSLVRGGDAGVPRRRQVARRSRCSRSRRRRRRLLEHRASAEADRPRAADRRSRSS